MLGTWSGTQMGGRVGSAWGLVRSAWGRISVQYHGLLQARRAGGVVATRAVPGMPAQGRGATRAGKGRCVENLAVGAGCLSVASKMRLRDVACAVASWSTGLRGHALCAGRASGSASGPPPPTRTPDPCRCRRAPHVHV